MQGRLLSRFVLKGIQSGLESLRKDLSYAKSQSKRALAGMLFTTRPETLSEVVCFLESTSTKLAALMEGGSEFSLVKKLQRKMNGWLHAAKCARSRDGIAPEESMDDLLDGKHSPVEVAQLSTGFSLSECNGH